MYFVSAIESSGKTAEKVWSAEPVEAVSLRLALS